MSRVLAAAAVVGFSGSRSQPCAESAAAVRRAVAAVRSGVPVSVGCASGVDELVRSLRPGARVFSVASVGFSGRGALAARSAACVEGSVAKMIE